jgi:phosphodiesterase/alkaline phosphatase D-like protein
MLGEAQLEWLKKGLGESRATFKIIGCGSPLLADYGVGSQADTWARYQPEQRDFVRWIFDNDVSGVIFVSGGKVGEITAIKRAQNHPKAYPLFELTCGALAGKTGAGGGAKDTVAENPNRQGEAVTGNDFATLDFGGVREHRFVTLRLRGEDGKMKTEQTLFATQLKK